ncbi:MAG: hypothetical protein V1900_04640 [Candidatus Aenigmatarchaeota archaeon]
MDFGIINIQVKSVNFISRFIARCAAEAVLSETAEDHHEKLERLQQRITQYGYPKPKSEKEGIFWQEYRTRFGSYI